MDQPFPLTIPHILVSIFKELSFEDQKNFLLVCKSWRDASLGTWRYSNAILVVDDQQNKKRLRNLVVYLQKYCKSSKARFYAIREKPFKQIRLCHSHMSLSDEFRFEKSYEEENSSIVWDRFYNRSAANLTSLTLNQCQLYAEGSLVNGFRLLLTKFINLFTLELDHCRFECRSPCDVNGIITIEIGESSEKCVSNKIRTFKLIRPRLTHANYSSSGCRYTGDLPIQDHTLMDIFKLMPELKELVAVKQTWDGFVMANGKIVSRDRITRK